MQIHELRVCPHGLAGVMKPSCVAMILRESIGPQPFGWVRPVPPELSSTSEIMAWLSGEIAETTEHFWQNRGAIPFPWRKFIFVQFEEAILSEQKT